MSDSPAKENRSNYNHESNIRDLNQLSLMVADHVTAMLAYWDKDLVCRYANRAYQIWFGKTREEMVGKMTIKELLGPLYEKNLPYINGVLQGKEQEFERIIPTPDGSGSRYSLANYYPDIVDGKVQGFFVHVGDITTIKKLELELRDSEIKFRGLLESAADAVVVLDKDGFITIVNTQFKKIFGYTSEEICGKNVEVLMPERFREHHRKFREMYYGSPAPRQMGLGLELVGLTKDGTEIPVDIRLGPIETKEGLLVSAAIRDMSWKVKKEKQLKQSAEIISNQNKLLLNFAYIVSHNLRNYSNNLTSVLNLLHNAKLEQEKHQYMDYLMKISNGLASTLDNLNELVEVQSKSSLELHAINLHDYINRCIDSFAIEIKSKGVTIKNEVDKSLVINYNDAYLESIIYNLISNAIKYRQPGRLPLIEVSNFYLDNYLVLKFKDNGRGIDLEKYGNKLFGMYKTFHGNPDAKGIGLFLTKYQVESLGGHIDVTSEVGVGTTFNIYFLLN